MKFTKQQIAIFIIILFHMVGLSGFFIPLLQPLFLKLVPWHLLLMLGMLCYSHRWFNLKFVAFLAIIALLGYQVEWVGINKHILFGNYVYGDVLGIKLAGVPLLIGVNWFLLTYATGTAMQQLKASLYVRVALGALIMVLLDVLIEPVAVKLGYWYWHDNTALLTAPVKNYADWFWVSAVMMVIFEWFKFDKQSKVGLVLLVSQFVFFLLLRWA